MRAYDTDIAFRYSFPDQDIVYHTVEEERTEFNFGNGGNLWAQPYQNSWFWTPAYEIFFKNRISTGTTADPREGTGWAFPALFELNQTWVLLHESGFDGNYHGSHLRAGAPNRANPVVETSAWLYHG